MVRFLKSKLLKQHKTYLEQYPLVPTFTANRSTFQPLFSITLLRGMYLLTLALCQGKPVYIFMARNRVSKTCLLAKLCFHCYVYFGSVQDLFLPFTTNSVVFTFVECHLQEFTLVKFTSQMFSSTDVSLTLKSLGKGGGQFDPPLWFSQNCLF